MKLHYKKTGEGAPLIILHGLYGSLENWLTIAKPFSEYFEIYLIDQRNHGQSPHSAEHNYALMSDDLLEFFDTHHIDKAVILGHSMGGKTAMFFALKHPERISRLIVADISPKTYKNNDENKTENKKHEQIIRAMQSIDWQNINSRKDIDNSLADTIKEKRVRQFLLKNSQKKGKNRYSWQLNIDAIAKNLPEIMKGITPDMIEKRNKEGMIGFPVLFIKGEKSNYISEKDVDYIKRIFPYSDIKTIKDAGHWLHAEKTEEFTQLVLDFVFG